MSEWKDIGTAPRNGTLVLVFAPDEDEPDMSRTALAAWQGYDEDAEWYGVDDVGLRYQSEQQMMRPTHWQPLPEGPK